MTVKRFFPISTEYLWKWQKKKNNGPKTVVPLSAVSFIRCNISPGIGMSHALSLLFASVPDIRYGRCTHAIS